MTVCLSVVNSQMRTNHPKCHYTMGNKAPRLMLKLGLNSPGADTTLCYFPLKISTHTYISAQESTSSTSTSCSVRFPRGGSSEPTILVYGLLGACIHWTEPQSLHTEGSCRGFPCLQEEEEQRQSALCWRTGGGMERAAAGAQARHDQAASIARTGRAIGRRTNARQRGGLYNG